MSATIILIMTSSSTRNTEPRWRPRRCHDSVLAHPDHQGSQIIADRCNDQMTHTPEHNQYAVSPTCIGCHDPINVRLVAGSTSGTDCNERCSAKNRYILHRDSGRAIRRLATCETEMSCQCKPSGKDDVSAQPAAAGDQRPGGAARAGGSAARDLRRGERPRPMPIATARSALPADRPSASPSWWPT